MNKEKEKTRKPNLERMDWEKVKESAIENLRQAEISQHINLAILELAESFIELKEEKDIDNGKTS